ncbi:MAG: hypothetical protein ACI4DZ_02720 [Oliverpabstia sp.]
MIRKKGKKIMKNTIRKILLIFLGIIFIVILGVFFKPYKFQLPDDADKIVVKYNDKTYILQNDDLKDILSYLKNLDVKDGRITIPPYQRGFTFDFYRRDTKIKTIYFTYVEELYTYDSYPIRHRIASGEIGEYLMDYLTAFDIRETIKKLDDMVSETELEKTTSDFEILKKLLSDESNFEYSIDEAYGYTLIISDTGFRKIIDGEFNEFMSGELHVHVNDSGFQLAELYISYIPDGDKDNAQEITMIFK